MITDWGTCVKRDVMKGREGSVNVMGRKGGNRLFPTLTLTLTFHHPEQSLLHKLHWLDHVIRVGVFSVSISKKTSFY